MFSLLEAFFTQYGYAAVFLVLVACGFGVPVPEDVTLVTGGVIAGLGHANVHTMFAVGMAGVLVGDGLMFTADGASGQNGTNGINGENGVNGQDGQNGQDGKDGQDGAAGRGIDNAMIDNDGYLILTMTDGTTINAGLVRDTSTVANKEANDSATAKSLATAAVGLSGASLLWNIAMLALSITMKRKYTTFHR